MKKINIFVCLHSRFINASGWSFHRWINNFWDDKLLSKDEVWIWIALHWIWMGFTGYGFVVIRYSLAFIRAPLAFIRVSFSWIRIMAGFG